MKTCTECREAKDESAFYENSRDGLTPVCRPCRIAYASARYYELVAAKMCPHCKGTPVPGRVYCAEWATREAQGRKTRKVERRTSEDVLL